MTSPNPTPTTPLAVRTIAADEHLGFIRQQRSASFLQTPAWAEVKSEWRAESLGWFHGEHLVGVALVLYRQLPKVKRFLAYIPEGPVIDWSADELSDWLAPMTKHLAAQGAFGVRMGPPVVTRRWTAADVKKGVADDLKVAGYPTKADPAKMNKFKTVVLLFWLVLLVTMVYGPIAAMLVEMFPTRIRYTGMSLPYHIGNGWFGGFLPTVSFALVAWQGDIYYGLWYPVGFALLTFVIGMLFVKETYHVDIHSESVNIESVR